MSALGAAWATETRKAIASRVVLATAAITVLGIAAIVLGFAAAVLTGNADAVAKLGPEAARPGWPGMLASALQVCGAALQLGFGVLQSWIVGREFADGTVAGLFGLAVGRGLLVGVKIALGVMLSVATGAVLVVLLVGAGLLLGFGIPDGEALGALGRLAVLVLLTALVAVPAALAATLGRGLLPGIAVAVVMLASAQVAVIAGAGPWYPVATPALWALDPGAVPPVALALPAALGLGCAALTVVAWRRLQLDR